jgi:hypothetical protein
MGMMANFEVVLSGAKPSGLGASGVSDSFKTAQQLGPHYRPRSGNAARRKTTARWLADGQVRQKR